MKIRRSEEVERIKKENICSMDLVVGKGGEPIMRVVEDIATVHELPLSNAFEIHKCNEFLRSLTLGLEIKFTNYTDYGSVIWHCMNLLTIKQGFTVDNCCVGVV